MIFDMREEILNFGDELSLVGILTHKSESKNNSDFCIVLLNAGLIHKIGPNSLHVKISRELAEKGVNCFRFDYSGIGDSSLSRQKKSLEEIKIGEVKQAMDLLQKKNNIQKFVLIGICSGAEDAFMVSHEDHRVIGLYLIDGVFQENKMLNSIRPIAQRNSIIRYYKKNIFSFKRWIKILGGKSGAFSRGNIMVLFKMASSFLKRKNVFRMGNNRIEPKNESSVVSYSNQIDFKINEWENLFNRNVHICTAFCEGGIAIDIFNLTISKQLKKDNKHGLLEVDLIKDVDHTFTPIWSQELLIGKISQWLENIQN